MRAVFCYRATTQGGEGKAGVLTADNVGEALQCLQGQGLIVLELEQSQDNNRYASELHKWERALLQPKVTLKDLSIMARQFSVLYGAGVTITRCLRTMHQQSSNPELKSVLSSVAAEVEAGQGLGESMQGFTHVFPATFYNMIAAGEASGSLDVVLDRAASYLEREYELEQRIKLALTYPKLVAGVALLIGAFLVTSVIPRFADMLGSLGRELPLPTRMLISLGGFLSNHGWTVMALVGGTVLFMSWYGKTAQGRRCFDMWSLYYPVFGALNRKKVVSRFCRSLGTLTQSGIPIVPAMALVGQTLGNGFVAAALRPVQEAVRMGQGVAPQLEDTGLFPPIVIHLVAVGEETGCLHVMLERAADFMDAEIRTMTDKITQLIEPVIILILGILVTFVILSIVIPMFDSFTTVT